MKIIQINAVYGVGSTGHIVQDIHELSLIHILEIEAIFVKGVRNIRLKEHEVAQYSEEQYLKNLDIIREKVSVIAANKKGKG